MVITLDFLRELYLHIEWADAKVWQALLSLNDISSESSLHNRLFHTHFTQRAFLQLWLGEKVERYDPARFPTLQEMYNWVHSYHRDLFHFLDMLDPSRLDEPVPVPWGKMFEEALGQPAEKTTLGETMFQVTSHSTYHRGQINMELRRLEGEPPLVDYIAWVWSGRPPAVWGEV